jgi:hypothetical protein
VLDASKWSALSYAARSAPGSSHSFLIHPQPNNIGALLSGAAQNGNSYITIGSYLLRALPNPDHMLTFDFNMLTSLWRGLVAKRTLPRNVTHTLPVSGLTCVATKAENPDHLPRATCTKARRVVIYLDVENGCHGLLKALPRSRLKADTYYEIRAYTGNSMVAAPRAHDPGRTYLTIRNDLPLKELTDVAIILDLSDALRRAGAVGVEKHVLISGNDKRYAALNHLLKCRNPGSFHFIVNFDTEKSLNALASV